jgi:hypothetical protein
METTKSIQTRRGWKMLFNLFLFSTFLLAGISCDQPSTSPGEESPVEAEETPESPNPYASLRDAALALTPDQLGIAPLPAAVQVYGIVMDWNVGNGIATLTAYHSGDASIYLSNGGGWVGGGEHPTVQKTVELFLQQGQNYPSEAQLTQSTPLPDTNGVFFYLLTPNGLQLGKTDLPAMEAGTSPWLPLFNAANLVVDAIQQVDASEK